jgi:hypothetical protein
VFVKDTNGNHVGCPECCSTDVRYSDTFHVLDLLNWFRKRHSLRCRKCRTRFYANTDEASNVMWVK